MKTGIPISTIAYDEYRLAECLTNLEDIGVISFWAYICHHGEGAGLSENKDHQHVYVELDEKVKLLEFKDYFRRSDGTGVTINWRKSDFQNWYWYVLHDVAYLESKGIYREYHYSPEDFIVSDPREFDRLFNETEVPEPCRVRKAIMAGHSLRDMYLEGLLKPSNAVGLKIISECLKGEFEDDNHRS